MKCCICGKEFIPRTHKQKTCGDKKCVRACEKTRKPKPEINKKRFNKTYHNESLDRKCKEYGHRYGEMQKQETLKLVGKVEI